MVYRGRRDVAERVVLLTRKDAGHLTKRWTWTSRMLNGGLRPVDLPIEVH